MSDRRVLLVGEIVVKGNRIEFKPGPAEFEAGADEDVEFAVGYHYEEDSEEKEVFDLAFNVELAGKDLGTSQAHVEDRPMVHDEEHGHLGRVAHIPPNGPLRGAWILEVQAAKGSWTEDDAMTRGFTRVGTFAVKVK